MLINYIRKTEWSDDAGPFGRMLVSVYGWYRNFKKKLKNSEDPKYSRFFLLAKNLKRNLSGSFNFVTIDQASLWTTEWIQTFPRQYDLIVGVPRSGMMIASIIALKLGKGLTTPDLLKQGKYWYSSQGSAKLSLDNIHHILLVDDSLDQGRAMDKAIDTIDSIGKDFSITRAALIVREETKHHVDIYHKIIAPPRTFEWNILHRKIASYNETRVLAVDMDGVLCANPPEGADDDEEWYLEWMKRANPYLIPGFEIDVILTCRLEKYRGITEDWLKRHNVRYKELLMWDLPAKSARQGRFAQHKIDVLLRIKPDMYWESNWEQAQRIWEDTRIPTLCIDEMIMLN